MTFKPWGLTTTFLESKELHCVKVKIICLDPSDVTASDSFRISSWPWCPKPLAMTKFWRSHWQPWVRQRKGTSIIIPVAGHGSCVQKLLKVRYISFRWVKFVFFHEACLMKSISDDEGSYVQVPSRSLRVSFFKPWKVTKGPNRKYIFQPSFFFRGRTVKLWAG